MGSVSKTYNMSTIDHNAIRRARKAAQKASSGKGRHVKVEGFSLREAKIERRERDREVRDALKFGQLVNEQIYALLDILDGGHAVHIVTAVDNELIHQACDELVKHIGRQAMPRYFVRNVPDGLVISTKIST